MVAVDFTGGHATNRTYNARNSNKIACRQPMRIGKLDSYDALCSRISIDAVIRVRRIQRRVNRPQGRNVAIIAAVLDVDLLVRTERHEVVGVGCDPVPHLAAHTLESIA